MKQLWAFLFAMWFLLFFVGAVQAHEKSEVYMKPGSHFLFAAASQYSLSTFCTRMIIRHTQGQRTPWGIKYGCRFATAGFIYTVASWEKRHYNGFNSDDFWADMAGVGTSLILLEW